MVSISNPLSPLSLPDLTSLRRSKRRTKTLFQALVDSPLWSTVSPLFSLLANEPQQQINGQG